MLPYHVPTGYILSLKRRGILLLSVPFTAFVVFELDALSQLIFHWYKDRIKTERPGSFACKGAVPCLLCSGLKDVSFSLETSLKK